MVKIGELIEDVRSVIGEGVHTGLRKFCESDEANTAWKAIHGMPNEEWSNVVGVVAAQVVRLLAGRGVVKLTPANKKILTKFDGM